MSAPVILSTERLRELADRLLGRSESAGDDSDVDALIASHEALRAELWRTRETGAVRVVIGRDDMADLEEFGDDWELPGRYALVIAERHQLVGTLDVLAAVGHTLLACVARERLQ